MFDLIKKHSYFFAVAFIVPSHPPDLVFNGFHAEESREHKRAIEISASKAELYKAEQLVRIINATTKIFRENSGHITIAATESFSHLESHDVFFKGATHIETPDGFNIDGHNLEYRQNENKVLTKEPIQFESTQNFQSAIIQGYGTGFEADLKMKSFFLNSGVNLTFVPKSPGGTTSKIRGDQMKVFSDRGWAQIEGNVAFQNQKLSLRSDLLSINFDSKNKDSKEEAFFQSTSNSRVISLFDSYRMSSKEVTLVLKNRKDISQVVAKGDVALSDQKGLEMSTESLEIENPQGTNRKMKLIGKVFIKRGSDEARCKEAHFDPTTDDLLLKGDASFKRGNDTISGQEIRYIKSKNILQVQGAIGRIQKNRVLAPKQNKGQNK